MTATKQAPARRSRMSRAAMARMADVAAQDAKPRPNPFAVPAHPPGVAGDAPTIAQDDALGATAGWAFGQVQAFGAEGVAFLGYAYLAELSQRPEYRRIVETICNEMTRRWIKLVAKGDGDKSDRIAAIEAEMRRLKVREVFRRAIESDGYFGRGHVFVDLGSQDPTELATDIGAGADDTSRAKVGRGALKGLRAVEAIWVSATRYDTSNPLSPNWYRPNAWMVQGREVHASRLLTMVGREVSDLLKPAYSFGGLPLTQMAKLYVDGWLRTRQSVSDLVASFSVSGIKTDLSDDLSTGDAGEDLLRRIQFFSATRTNLGTMILNKDEEFFNVQTALGTLDKLQAQSQEQVGSAVKIPLVKFTGLQPSGLNASSEGELDSFYDDIHGQQEQMLRPPLTTIINLVQISLFGEVDPDIAFEFEHLQELDEAEAANVSKTRAETDAILVGEGILMPEESRKRIAGEFGSPYAGLDLSVDVSAPQPGDLDEPPTPPGADAWRDAVKADARAEAARAEDAEFSEEDHPRASNGQFGSGGSKPAKVKAKSGATERTRTAAAHLKGSGAGSTAAAEKAKGRLAARPEVRRTTSYGPVRSGGGVQLGVAHIVTENTYGDKRDRVMGAFHSREDAHNHGMALATGAARNGRDAVYRTYSVRNEHGDAGHLHVVLGQSDGYGSKYNGEDATIAGIHADRGAAREQQHALSKQAWEGAGYDEPHPGVETANQLFRRDGEVGGYTVHRVPIQAPRGSAPSPEPKRDLLSMVLGSAAHDARRRTA